MEQKLWSLQQLGFNEKKSVRRLYAMIYLPLRGQNFNFLQNMDQRSIFYIYYSKCTLVLKRRLFKEENGEEEFGG